MVRCLTLFAVCALLAGCSVMVLRGDLSSDPVTFTEAKPISGEEIAAIPVGSTVSIENIMPEAFCFTTGEVLHASPHGLALMNAAQDQRSWHGDTTMSKVPYVNRLFKNTGLGQKRLPVYWVPTREITNISVLKPPPEGYVAPQLAIDTNDELEFERIGLDFDFNVDEEFEVPTGTGVVPFYSVNGRLETLPDLEKSAVRN